MPFNLVKVYINIILIYNNTNTHPITVTRHTDVP